MSAEDPQGAAALERQGYRRRRLTDAARVLPLVGAALLLVPLLWPGARETAEGVEPVRTSMAILYIFGTWAGLIVAAGLFGLAVRHQDTGGADGPGQG
ncbi:hypothetical protein [Seohaeicola zhoushanensis]|uniref:Uncharacterized protein n=1 Tax=Seohaeicola zhoushanensis TaxID=1569283 RepID=A0A8J3GWS6_9RHOB|nr:hypothetical protein [Seohaeicola zhoushanensis]GHF49236.1 hypothetical protein GCM10017056_21090 [Seohaeicola zhoushanensis]